MSGLIAIVIFAKGVFAIIGSPSGLSPIAGFVGMPRRGIMVGAARMTLSLTTLKESHMSIGTGLTLGGFTLWGGLAMVR